MASDKRVFRTAVLKVLNEEVNGSGKSRLDFIVDKLVNQAFEGDLASIKECMAIVDGKGAQQQATTEDIANAAATRVMATLEEAIERAAKNFSSPPLIEMVSVSADSAAMPTDAHSQHLVPLVHVPMPGTSSAAKP